MSNSGDEAFPPPSPGSHAPLDGAADDAGTTTDEPEQHQDRRLRPGQMSFGWRLAYFVGFSVAVAALGSVWAVATQIGHTTWWMGPAGAPNVLIVQLLPFYLPVAVLFGIVLNRRGVAVLGIVAGVAEVAVGVIDLYLYRNLGILEISIGVAMMGVAAAALGGVLRSVAESSR